MHLYNIRTFKIFILKSFEVNKSVKTRLYQSLNISFSLIKFDVHILDITELQINLTKL